MAQKYGVGPKPSWLTVGRGFALTATTSAALISITTWLFSYGLIGKSETHLSIGNIGAAWVKLRPEIDTAYAIGDTIRFAATVADRKGSVLIGARPTWTTADSSIAAVESDGAVVARGPGSTTVSAVVGSLVAHGRVVVRQRVAGVVVSSPLGEITVVVPEEANIQFRARPVDARGHTVQRGVARVWHVDDTTVAHVDADGMLTARTPGRTVIRASVDGIAGYLGVSVVTAASSLTLLAGDGQRALAGRPLPQRIVVRVTNRKGVPAAGKTIVFRSAEGQGSMDPASGVTDADGRARTAWTLGDDPGRQTLLASVEGVDSALAVAAEADPVARNTRVAALVQRLTARAGTTLTDSVGVRITDSTGRALADVPVRWTALNGGTVVGADRSDSLGVAHARWTLAPTAGTQRVRAQVGAGAAARGITPVTISATALAGAPVNIVVVSGNGQRASAGAALAKPVAIRVVDSSGNGVGNVEVHLAPSAGTVPDTALLTDSLGVARTRWTMGRSAGAHSLAVRVEGLRKLVKLSARALPGKAANLSFDDAPGGGEAARSRTKRLVAIVTDVYGNPVPDAPVNFSVKWGAVNPARAMTDGRGRVALRWLMGSRSGEQTLTGVVRGSDVKGAFVSQTSGPPTAAKSASGRPPGA